jgi:hypothetical protein
VEEIKAFGKFPERKSHLSGNRDSERSGIPVDKRSIHFDIQKPRNPEKRYDCGHIRQGRVDHESSPEG